MTEQHWVICAECSTALALSGHLYVEVVPINRLARAVAAIDAEGQ